MSTSCIPSVRFADRNKLFDIGHLQRAKSKSSLGKTLRKIVIRMDDQAFFCVEPGIQIEELRMLSRRLRDLQLTLLDLRDNSQTSAVVERDRNYVRSKQPNSRATIRFAPKTHGII